MCNIMLIGIISILFKLTFQGGIAEFYGAKMIINRDTKAWWSK